ncbi:MAG: hypothetical protein WCB49_10475 [Gammaproteobacteria bacterium]
MTDKPTDAGTPVTRDEHSLTIGPREPLLRQNSQLIEKLAHH